jgi:MSHA pilin protein MshD
MFIDKMKKNKGFTLVEVIVAMSIIALTVVSVLKLFQVNTMNSSDPMITKQMMTISESLMEEVLSKQFTKPSGGFAGPYTSANRAYFDTVTDYNNLVINPMSSVNNAAFAALASYNATITVVATALNAIPSSDSYLVTVTVNGPSGKSFVLRSYRINYA